MVRRLQHGEARRLQGRAAGTAAGAQGRPPVEMAGVLQPSAVPLYSCQLRLMIRARKLRASFDWETDAAFDPANSQQLK